MISAGDLIREEVDNLTHLYLSIRVILAYRLIQGLQEAFLNGLVVA